MCRLFLEDKNYSSNRLVFLCGRWCEDERPPRARRSGHALLRLRRSRAACGVSAHAGNDRCRGSVSALKLRQALRSGLTKNLHQPGRRSRHPSRGRPAGTAGGEGAPATDGSENLHLSGSCAFLYIWTSEGEELWSACGWNTTYIGKAERNERRVIAKRSFGDLTAVLCRKSDLLRSPSQSRRCRAIVKFT
jgi:hypothetical protein